VTRLRTWTDKDGVFIHAGDLEDSLRRIAKDIGDSPSTPAILGVANAVDEARVRALEHAAAESFSESPFIREIRRLLGR